MFKNSNILPWHTELEFGDILKVESEESEPVLISPKQYKKEYFFADQQCRKLSFLLSTHSSFYQLWKRSIHLMWEMFIFIYSFYYFFSLIVCDALNWKMKVFQPITQVPVPSEKYYNPKYHKSFLRSWAGRNKASNIFLESKNMWGRCYYWIQTRCVMNFGLCWNIQENINSVELILNTYSFK